MVGVRLNLLSQATDGRVDGIPHRFSDFFRTEPRQRKIKNVLGKRLPSAEKIGTVVEILEETKLLGGQSDTPPFHPHLLVLLIQPQTAGRLWRQLLQSVLQNRQPLTNHAEKQKRMDVVTSSPRVYCHSGR
jgi:hypothetical protein